MPKLPNILFFILLLFIAPFHTLSFLTIGKGVTPVFPCGQSSPESIYHMASQLPSWPSTQIPHLVTVVQCPSRGGFLHNILP